MFKTGANGLDRLCCKYFNESQPTANADTIINLNLALYQNRIAKEDVSTDLVVNKDSLATLIAAATPGNLYEKAQLLPDSYYELSSNKLAMNSGEKEGKTVSLTIH